MAAAPHVTFDALGDPTRITLVERLARGPATVGALAEPLEMSLPAVSKHLSVLERAGLITRERRGREVLCTLQVDALTEAGDWAIRTAAYWRSAFARLDAVLTEDRQEVDHAADTPTEGPTSQAGRHPPRPTTRPPTRPRPPTRK